MPSVNLPFFSLKPLLHDLELQSPACLHLSYKTLSLFSKLNNPNELQKNVTNLQAITRKLQNLPLLL